MLDPHRLRVLAQARHWNEAEAREALGAFDRSGLSLTEFTAQTKITADRLTRWRKRLAKADAPRLLKVELRRSELQCASSPAIAIVLVNGVRIEVNPGATVELITIVLEAARRC